MMLKRVVLILASSYFFNLSIVSADSITQDEKAVWRTVMDYIEKERIGETKRMIDKRLLELSSLDVRDIVIQHFGDGGVPDPERFIEEEAQAEELVVDIKSKKSLIVPDINEILGIHKELSVDYFFSLSRVGFNDNLDKALVAVEYRRQKQKVRRTLASSRREYYIDEPSFYILEKYDGSWKVKKSYPWQYRNPEIRKDKQAKKKIRNKTITPLTRGKDKDVEYSIELPNKKHNIESIFSLLSDVRGQSMSVVDDFKVRHLQSSCEDKTCVKLLVVGNKKYDFMPRYYIAGDLLGDGKKEHVFIQEISIGSSVPDDLEVLILDDGGNKLFFRSAQSVLKESTKRSYRLGYLEKIGISDYDNDGTNEMFVAVSASPGQFFVSIKEK